MKRELIEGEKKKIKKDKWRKYEGEKKWKKEEKMRRKNEREKE